MRQFGMSEVLGPISFPEENDSNPYATSPYSKGLHSLIDEEARKLINDAYDKTEKILRENKDKLELVR